MNLHAVLYLHRFRPTTILVICMQLSCFSFHKALPAAPRRQLQRIWSDGNMKAVTGFLWHLYPYSERLDQSSAEYQMIRSNLSL